jgi:hypothetical protein
MGLALKSKTRGSRPGDSGVFADAAKPKAFLVWFFS